MNTPISTPSLSPTVLTRIETSAKTMADPILSRAQSVQITDSGSYQKADLFLVELRTAMKQIDSQLDVELNTPIIEPARKALDALYAVRRQILSVAREPLERAEKTIKAKMAEWQRADHERLEREQRAQRERELAAQREAQRKLDEEVRLRREAEEAQKRAAEAVRRNAQVAEQNRLRDEALRKEALARQAEMEKAAAEAKVESIQEERVAGPTVAAGSNVRKTRKWRLKEPDGLAELLKAVIAGQVPEIVVQVNEEVMDEYYKADRALVEQWPGVEGYWDFGVAGRSAR